MIGLTGLPSTRSRPRKRISLLRHLSYQNISAKRRANMREGVLSVGTLLAMGTGDVDPL